MKLTVLGSGITIPPPGVAYRYPAAHMVEVDGATILLDAGLGALPQLYKAGKTLRDIDAIFITHFHADHCNLIPILQSFFVHFKHDGVKQSIKIYGPQGIEKRLDSELSLHEFSWNELKKYAEITAHDYIPKQAIKVTDGLSVTPFSVQHGDLDAYSLRVESEGRCLAYSGDATDCPGLRDSAVDADLFLCESAKNLDGPEKTDKHVGPIGAARIAQDVGARHLVFTHYSGLDSDEAMISGRPNCV